MTIFFAESVDFEKVDFFDFYKDFEENCDFWF